MAPATDTMAGMHVDDTIVAIATARGAGGVGIVRLSGPSARAIGQAICTRRLRPRSAVHADFVDTDGIAIDDGIALFFPQPASYTGEDTVELQAHGSPAVLQALVDRCLALGARQARAGEFTERAWRNGKLDLLQAEAVADLVAASSLQSARAARRSLEGVFSARVEAVATQLLALRVQVEAAIDFSDESLATLDAAAIQHALDAVAAALATLLADATRGAALHDGLQVVIIGPPNAGKSSLFNALARREGAIVSDIPGTTRDLLREQVGLDGVAITLVDSAGLHAGGDAIEREGMRRARAAVGEADIALVVLDARQPDTGHAEFAALAAAAGEAIWLHNKSDLLPDPESPGTPAPTAIAPAALPVSARTGLGLATLQARLLAVATGAPAATGDGDFSARARHLQSLQAARDALDAAAGLVANGGLDLAAEHLRIGHDALGEVTGRVLPDDLLGAVFSTFCIGK